MEMVTVDPDDLAAAHQLDQAAPATVTLMNRAER